MFGNCTTMEVENNDHELVDKIMRSWQGKNKVDSIVHMI